MTAIDISLPISLATCLSLISGPWNFISWNIKICLCSLIFSSVSQKCSIRILHQNRRQSGCTFLPFVGICRRKVVKIIWGTSLSLVSWNTTVKSFLFVLAFATEFVISQNYQTETRTQSGQWSFTAQASRLIRSLGH